MHRVKCYGKTDFAYRMYDERIKKLISKIEMETITDLIEYNKIIMLYEADNEYLPGLTSDVIISIKECICRIMKKRSLETDEWIYEIKNSTEYSIDDLISLIVKFKKDILDDEFILKILTDRNVCYTNIIKVKEFKNYILDNFTKIIDVDNKSLLEALVREVIRSDKLYSCKLNEEDTNKLIESYINHEHNLNCLLDIYNSKNKKIEAPVRVKTMTKYKKLISLFKGKNTVSKEFEFKVLSGEDETDLFFDKKKYCEHWNFDEEILKYGKHYTYEAIYEFLLTDFGIFQKNKIWVAHYSQDGYKGVNTIAYQGYNTYASINHLFRTNQKIQIWRMSIFIEYLKSKNINIYELINYFIEQILKNGFYAINDSENYSTYNISAINKHLCIQIESLLSQYACLVKHKVIREDYISLDSNTLDLKKIKSLNTINCYVKNFVYYNLMDSQSSYSMPINEEYDKRMYNQIKEHQITSYIYQDLDKNHIDLLNILEEMKILEWKDDKLVFTCEEELPYWEEMFNTGAIVSVNTGDTILTRIIDDEMVSTDTNLFDKFEIDYFNYIFNNQTFNDGLAIRNKYLHTGQVDVDECEVNIILIKLLIEVIMKIHFSLYHK